MRTFLIRTTFSLALALVLGVLPAAAAQAPEGPTLVVANPDANAMLTPGSLTIEGVAFDPIATQGAGVDRVSVFLDNRDAGGIHLGDAKLGEPTFMPNEPPFAGWILVTPALKGTGDSHDLFVYAHSAVTGDETMIRIPVVIGEKAGGGLGFETTQPTAPADAGQPGEPSVGD